jgi:Rha family phage regulatory protein
VCEVTAKIIKLRQIDGLIYASSLDIANDFGKDHKHVLRDIEAIIQVLSPDLGSAWFRPSSYYDPTQRRLRCYDLSRQAWSLVALGYTGRDAMDFKVAYILKFDEMEAKLGANARTDALFDRAKHNNVVRLDPQAEFAFESSPPGLPIVDPVREEAELEAELRRFNETLGYEAELPKGLVAIDEKQRRAYLKAWRKKHDNDPNQLNWPDDSPQMCYGPGGILTERYEV